jgi:hypothetical protein
MVFDGTPTRWLATIWHYLVILFVIAGGLWALIELPSAISLRYRQIRDNLALRSLSSASKRLKKLESELVKLNQAPEIDQYQAKFYSVVLFCFCTCTLGLASWVLSIYLVQHDHPSPWMALAAVMFLLSSFVSVASLSHFRILMQEQRTMRRREIEAGITAMKNKLLKSTERIEPVL